MNSIKSNTEILQQEISWLKEVIERRMSSTFGKNAEGKEDLFPPELAENDAVYSTFIHEHNLNAADRLLLIMSLTIHLQPDFFDRLILLHPHYSTAQKEASRYGSRYNELGGISGDCFRGFIPTGLTWIFLLAGADMSKRIELLSGLNSENILLSKGIISFSSSKDCEPLLSGGITIEHDWLRYLSIGDVEMPEDKK